MNKQAKPVRIEIAFAEQKTARWEIPIHHSILRPSPEAPGPMPAAGLERARHYCRKIWRRLSGCPNQTFV